MSAAAQTLLAKIQGLVPPATPFNLLNVCGGHERSITQAGLRAVLPEWLKLIPGPGCPVCVCPEEDIALAITLALNESVIVLAFGDLLRVPITGNASNTNAHKIRSLEVAKAAGGDIRPIASPLEAKAIARQNPDKTVIFFAAGFETTMAPVAALAYEICNNQLPDNLQFLISGRRTWPAVNALLQDKQALQIHGMIAPGHVATVMGANEWQFLIDDYAIPTAIAGFEAESLMAAFLNVLQQAQSNKLQLGNCYPQVVTPEGNKTAQQLLNACFAITSSRWRGIGSIPCSGYELKPQFNHINARITYAHHSEHAATIGKENIMPKSCQCADVVMARRQPHQCPLYGNGCTPRQPVGPCMVSDEGACRIWWSAGVNAA
ncbi:hydrogenase expression/formation protein HypD [Alteromonadaceae bacterium 2753L.S.0a.02]|nr:hydrogenase expression/formation protein HypD [Alteromonadaceae bacterium 2753L.S.0a.02]